MLPVACSLTRDHEVKQGLAQAGVECKSFNSDLLYEPWEVVGADGQPLTNFESFWKRCAWCVRACVCVYMRVCV